VLTALYSSPKTVIIRKIINIRWYLDTKFLKTAHKKEPGAMLYLRAVEKSSHPRIVSVH